ncbi:EamA family transporter RarD [Burkholderia sp. USMB20]|uniref:EamA family transporter RarD n=1 Tax=Burkholderia sp. USMB20 TaxID=1571773 RepID=UPI001092EAD6|nr:EamA family transporter RarD [Burkholderia sp. USMB20]TGN99340.1 EamA family transporter RarD [Burkholderia sp. USMB20]
MTGYPEAGRGIALSVMASTLFALMSAYAKLLAPLTGLDIFAWRILWTAPGALALIALRGRWPALVELVRRGVRDWRLLVALPASAALLGLQLWLFLWAPLHGRMLEVSLGYFLLPLTMVLVGRFYYHDGSIAANGRRSRMRGARRRARVWATRAFAWPTLVVALGYPPYFVLRRRINADSLAAFALEIVLLCPVAFAMVSASATPVASHPLLWSVLLPGLGVLSTLALASYLKASRMLPMALFGILGYVEPVLLVAVSLLLLGETLSAAQLATYGPIWAAVALTAWHSAMLMRRLPARG